MMILFWAAVAIVQPVAAPVLAESHPTTRSDGQSLHVPTGLALARPHVRGKAPVVFVHGLWDSPSSWRPMIEACAADPVLGGRFQFWTFGYSTGNPIPYSSYLLRRDLDEVRRRLDPAQSDPAFDQIVLVGHSMGGLLCKMVGVDSGDRLWRVVSDRPASKLSGDREDIELVRNSLIFRAHPGVRRVIYIATPHRGSQSNRGVVRAIGTRAVVVPNALRAVHHRLIADNSPSFFREPFRNGLPSSVDELEWDSPMLTGLSELVHPPSLKFHTIIAVRPDSRPESRTDGLVSYESAHVAGAASEKVVSASHLCLDRPEVIGEVRRILREHADAPEPAGRPRLPGGAPPLATIHPSLDAAWDAPR